MKMYAQEKVYEELKKLYEDGKEKVTAEELANRLSLSRQVVSHYLNRLNDEDKVIKIKTKPVYWSIREDKYKIENNVFEKFIGYRGSQKKLVESCIAAIKYPPNGLSILLTGKSGVGKSFLARLIYKYSIDKNLIVEESPFVVLNCADYANNPELLSSILFGYKKGAFTGANKDKIGLISEANGGYLFLDEVHRLSKENQEKLFLFIDSGKFRPVGENSVWHKSKVRFIFATTENPNEVFLEAFKRRIQVMLNISSFDERPFIERVQLVLASYYEEAKRIHKNLIIRGEVISTLCSVKMDGNLGRLKNIAQLSCAEEYLKQEGQDKIIINLESLGLKNDIKNIKLESFKDTEIYWDKPIENDDILGEDLTAFFENLIIRLNKYSNMEDIKELKQIKNNLYKLIQSISKADRIRFTPESEYLEERFTRLWHDILIDRYGAVNSTPIIKGLFNIYLYIQRNSDIQVEGIKETYSIVSNNLHRSLYIADKFVEYSSKEIGKIHEIFNIILCLMLSDYINEQIQLKGLLIAHGKSTASSIQSVINKMCNTYVFEAIDMPIETTVTEIIKETKEFIKKQDTSNGLVLLVDTGSLNKMYSSIKNEIKGDLLIVNNLTTAVGLDIGYKMLQNVSFKDIARKASTEYKISSQYFEGFSQNKNIIISCMSGVGISVHIRDIMKKYIHSEGLDILAVEYREIKQVIKDNNIDKIDNTKLVISTTTLPKSFLIPSINIYDILDIDGTKKFYECLKEDMSKLAFNNMMEELLRLFSTEGIADKLTFLNPDVVIKEVEVVMGKYINYYNINFDGKFKLNLYMHISLMIERILLSARNYIEDEMQLHSEEEEEFFMITKSFFQPIEMKFNINVDSYEISLLYEIFKSYIM